MSFMVLFVVVTLAIIVDSSHHDNETIQDRNTYTATIVPVPAQNSSIV